MHPVNGPEEDEEEDASVEDVRELWGRLCREKARRIGLEHQHSAWVSLVDKCEEWNEADDDRHPALKTDLADDPWTYDILEKARASNTDGYAAGQCGEAAVNPTDNQYKYLVLMQGMRDLAEWALIHDESLVLRRLFNLKVGTAQ